MAHIRIQQINETTSRKYEMTVDIVRTVGDPKASAAAQADKESAAAKVYEEFCSIGSIKFEKCESFKNVWLGLMIIPAAFAFIVWFMTNFHVA